MAGVRIAAVTSWPSMSVRGPRSNVDARATAATAGPSVRSTRACTAFQATERYIAPVSMCEYESRAATVRATVPFPAPDGPSIAMMSGRDGMTVHYYGRDEAL